MKQQTNEEIALRDKIVNLMLAEAIHTDNNPTIGDLKRLANLIIQSTRLSTIQVVEGKMKSLWADELNGDYTEEEKKNPLVAYNAALKRVLQVLASMKG